MTKIKNWRASLHGAEFKVLRLQESTERPLDSVDTPDAINRYLRPKLANSLIYRTDVENFIIVQLNSRKRAIGWEVMSTGTLDTIIVHPREVFRHAILMNAAGIVVAHNHPSGDPAPSEADIKVTRDLIRAGQLLRIEVVDHIILGQATLSHAKDFVSLRELGYFFQ